MSAPMEGPFAEKLKSATVGREFPKVAVDADIAAASLDLSGGGKSGREKRRAKHEEQEKDEHGGAGVFGRAVHTRGQFVESIPADAPLQTESQERDFHPRGLWLEIQLSHERIKDILSKYPEIEPSNIEGMPFLESLKADYQRSGDLVAPYFSDGKINDFHPSEYQDTVDELRTIHFNFESYYNALASAVNPSKPTTDISESETKEKEHSGLEGGEKGLSFEKKLTMLEARMSDWIALRKEILAEGDSERLNMDFKNVVARDLAKKRVLDSVADEITMYRTALVDKKRPGKLEWSWLDQHLEGLDEMLSAGVVIRDQILKERKGEASKITAEKAVQRKKTDSVDRVPVSNEATERMQAFEEKLAELDSLLERWRALSKEFDSLEFETALLRVRKGKSVPPVKDLEDWLAKKSTPESWSKQDKGYISEGVLPDMEVLVRQAEKAAKKLRDVPPSAAVEGVVSPEPREPVAKVIGLDRRVIERDETGELLRTEWQRMNIGEQNHLKGILFEKRNDYLTRANERLKKNGLTRAVDRLKLVRERLDGFMLRIIEKEIVLVKLTDADRQALLKELSKETEAFFAQ